jgi:hypothetical protein
MTTLQPTRDYAVDPEKIVADLAGSKQRLAVFRTIYSGGNQPKDAKSLAKKLGMTHVAVLQIASPLAHKRYFEALKHRGLLAFRKYPEINAIRHQIFRRAERGRGALHETTKRTAAAKSPLVAVRGTGQKMYDVALSFAGEDREYAEKLARKLKRTGVSFFYDKYEQANLWGNDLYVHLQDVYARRSRFCVVFISRNYKRKFWTRHELRSAQEKALRRHKAYILPVRIDDTQIPGLFANTSYLDLRVVKVEGVFKSLIAKLGKSPGNGSVPKVPVPRNRRK